MSGGSEKYSTLAPSDSAFLSALFTALRISSPQLSINSFGTPIILLQSEYDSTKSERTGAVSSVVESPQSRPDIIAARAAQSEAFLAIAPIWSNDEA